MALRLQMRGYIIRWATYSKGGFKEGVSLTVDDELNRWQKYAYGEYERSHFRLFLPTTDECIGCNECVNILSQLALCTNHRGGCCSILWYSGGGGGLLPFKFTNFCGPAHHFIIRYLCLPVRPKAVSFTRCLTVNSLMARHVLIL